jgi:hypothetical protein
VLIPRVPSSSSPGKGLYNPKAFVTHAASLDQACAHCPRFPTAASRRSLGRVSVPVWPIILSDRLPIAGTVGRYPTVYLIGRGPIPGRELSPRSLEAVSGVSGGFPPLSRTPGQVPTRYSPVRRSGPKPRARLACVKRAASVRSEPGSNSQLHPGTNWPKKVTQTTPGRNPACARPIQKMPVTAAHSRRLHIPSHTTSNDEKERRGRPCRPGAVRHPKARATALKKIAVETRREALDGPGPTDVKPLAPALPGTRPVRRGDEPSGPPSQPARRRRTGI